MFGLSMHSKTAKALVLLTFGLLSASAFAQIDACTDAMGHEGTEKITYGQNNNSVTGNVGSSPYHYEIWYQGGNNSLTYYDNGTYKASWSGTSDFLARVGFKYDEKQTYEQVGPIDAYFNWKKQGSAGGYNYIGIYGWTVDPLVEYYIVDDWFNKPGANLLGQRKGEFTVDGDTYEIWQNTRIQQPSIKGEATFPQYFSVRKSYRNCGHIDVTAHFKKWEELGMRMGKMYEAKVLIEAGGGSGSFDVTYLKMTDKAHPLSDPDESSSSEAKSSSSIVRPQPPKSSMAESSSSSEAKSSSSSKRPKSSASKSKSDSSEESKSDTEEPESSDSEEESSSSEENNTTVIGSLQKILTDDSGRSFLVFDMQGRYLGTIEYRQGLNLKQILFEKFRKPGIYLVRRGKTTRMVRITP
ncbi:MAG: glycoside hydrolase family 11 protein [Fibrobacter sp.]|nr:glycoside hydrolase family 11 protein [Fibrobacter sp.]